MPSTTGTVVLWKSDGGRAWPPAFRKPYRKSAQLPPASTGSPDRRLRCCPTASVRRHDDSRTTHSSTERVRHGFATGIAVQTLASTTRRRPAGGVDGGVQGLEGHSRPQDPANAGIGQCSGTISCFRMQFDIYVDLAGATPPFGYGKLPCQKKLIAGSSDYRSEPACSLRATRRLTEFAASKTYPHEMKWAHMRAACGHFQRAAFLFEGKELFRVLHFLELSKEMLAIASICLYAYGESWNGFIRARQRNKQWRASNHGSGHISRITSRSPGRRLQR